jgi:chaperonin GroES
VKVIPIGDHVVIRRIDAPLAAASGIVLPETVKNSAQQGRIVSVGDGRRLADGSRAAHLVREGDRVLFANYAGIEVTVSGEQLLIMGEDETGLAACGSIAGNGLGLFAFCVSPQEKRLCLARSLCPAWLD